MSLLAFMLFACGQNKDYGENTIGTPIDQGGRNGSMQVFEMSGNVYFSSYDQASGRINFVDPQVESLSFSPKNLDTSHTWLATKSDSYAFDVSKREVKLLSNGFSSSQSLFNLAGEIESWAVDLSQGYVAFVDEFFSIALVQLDSTGQVLKKWTGGPLIDGSRTVLAGEMMPGGKLLFLIDDGSLLLIDMEATLTSERWVFESKDFQFIKPDWIGRVEEGSDRALVHDANGLHLVNLSTGSKLETLALAANLTFVKNGIHHAYYYESASESLVLIRPTSQDELQEVRLKIGAKGILQSYLSQEYFVALDEEGNVTKVRLSDGLVLVSKPLKGVARVGLSENYVVAMYESALGAVDVWNLDQGTTKSFQAFNWPSLKD